MTESILPSEPERQRPSGTVTGTGCRGVYRSLNIDVSNGAVLAADLLSHGIITGIVGSLSHTTTRNKGALAP